MKNLFPGVLLLAFGAVSVIFNRWAAGLAAAWQRWLTGDEHDELPYRLGYIIIGAVFVVMGLMVLAGYLSVR